MQPLVSTTQSLCLLRSGVCVFRIYLVYFVNVLLFEAEGPVQEVQLFTKTLLA